MTNLTAGIIESWHYLWRLHCQAKAMISLNFMALIGKDSNLKRGEERPDSSKIDAEDIIPGGEPGGKGSMDIEEYGIRRRIGLVLGPALFSIFLLMPTPEGMSYEAHRVLASTI